MHQVLLLHTNREYAETLAETVAGSVSDFEVSVVSRVPVAERIEALLTDEYDLIQADELFVNGILGSCASFLRRRPLVTALRGWADYTNAHEQYGRLQAASFGVRARLSLVQSSATIFISDRTRSEFTSKYRVRNGVTVNRPIDIDYYRSGSVESRETFDILTVTNFRYEDKYRGVEIILRALEPLFERRPDLYYRIAGGGQYLDRLDSFLDEYEYANQVVVCGYVDDIADEFASADLFTYLSFLDAYPTVVLEAQAAGLPVVAGSAVGVPCAVGDAGVLCDPSGQGMREGLAMVVDDPQRRAELSAASRQKMATYNQDCAAAHADVWRSVLQDE